MEARNGATGDDDNLTAATNSWKDRTQTSGEIRKLQKTLGYVSGLRV